MSIAELVGSKAGLAADLLGKQKTWRDRLKQAAYTSPVSKTRIQFDYEDVSRDFDIRGTAFDFRGVNNSYVQPGGYTSRRYPLVCYFSGRNCDLLATAFEAALLEPGTGKLEHPLYGTVSVIPFGTVTRNDALKTAANQTVVTVTFWTTVGAVYPSAQSNAKNEIEAAIAGFNVAAAQQFAGNTNLRLARPKASAIGTIKGLLKTVQGALAKASSAVSKVRKDFAKGMAAINGGLDTLIGQPLGLALQISNLIQAPGRALTGLSSRLDGYAALADSIFGSSAGNPSSALSSASILLAHQTDVANNFHISSLFALSAVSGSVVSVTAQSIGGDSQGLSPAAATFSTRTQVLAAAAAMLDQLDELNAWRDKGFGALTDINTEANYQVDTGEAIAALQEAVALAAGYLVQASFALLPEKAIVLGRPRTIIDLCSEVYLSTDDAKLDLLIGTNNLTGDEILELPAGKRIVYYPS